MLENPCGSQNEFCWLRVLFHDLRACLVDIQPNRTVIELRQIRDDFRGTTVMVKDLRLETLL